MKKINETDQQSTTSFINGFWEKAVPRLTEKERTQVKILEIKKEHKYRQSRGI